MTGYCNVDGRICKFLADTGAQRTVIDVSVLGNTNGISPCLFKVQLADKSEATVLGVKKCFQECKPQLSIGVGFSKQMSNNENTFRRTTRGNQRNKDEWSQSNNNR